MKFAPFVSLWFIIPALVIALLLLLRSHRLMVQEAGASTARFSLLLRVVLLVVAGLMLLNPYREVSEPDPQKVVVAVVRDVSLSMQALDCDDVSRRDKALELRQQHPLFSSLARQGNLQDYVFDKELHFQPNAEKTSSALASTSIGKSLEQLRQRSGGTLGAVVLLSDGGENGSLAMTQLLKQPEWQGIPVHTVALGGLEQHPDLAVSFMSPPEQVEKNRYFTLKARVSRNEAAPLECEVLLNSGLRQVEKRQVVFKTGELSKELEFKLREFVSGSQFYTVRVAEAKGETALSNNVDYTALNVEGVQNVRIFAMLGMLDPEFSVFRRMASAGDSFISLDGAIRTGKENWIEFKGKKQIYSESFLLEKLDDYDVLIMDGIASTLNAEELRRVREFVFNKGGGLLVLGDLHQPLLEALQGTHSSELGHSADEQLLALTDQSFLWRPLLGERSEISLSGAFPLQPGESFIKVTEPGLAQTVQLRVGDDALLLSAPAGLGRVIWSGVSSWRWALRDKRQGDMAQLLWTRTLNWLSHGSMPRLKLLNYRGKYNVGQPLSLTWRALNASYRADLGMPVKAELLLADGTRRALAVEASDKRPGIYSLNWTPPREGEYQLLISADEGRSRVSRELLLVASVAGAESSADPMNNLLLQEVARASDAKYYYWKDLPSTAEGFRLSQRVPQRLTQHFLLAEAAWLCVLLLLLCCSEWYVRRRVGTP